MSVAHRVNWLVLGSLLVGLVPVCYTQYETVLREVQWPYPISTNWKDVSGSVMTFGPDAAVIDGKYYRALQLISGRLFVGGRAQLFSVNPDNLELLKNVSIPTTGSSSCDYCDNYIRLIHPLPNGALLECGTDNANPSCRQRSIADLSESTPVDLDVLDSGSSVAPFIYNQNSTGFFITEDQEVFVGTYLVEMDHPAIVNAALLNNISQNVIGISEQLRTGGHVLTNSDNPQFVGDPISYNGRIYFFYREKAAEVPGENLVYSRVAVVCQNDTGGQQYVMDLPETNLITNVKARLRCFIDGTVPYNYNEIQDVYQSTKDNEVVFAIFATRAPETASSAVCAFRLDEIEALFLSTSNKFLYQQTNGFIWTTVDTDPITPRLITCQRPDSIMTAGPAIVQRGQLMSTPAENKLHYETTGGALSNPLLVINRERFSQIVVDEDVVNSIDVMFIGTENGSVIKAYLNSDRSEAKVVEEIILDTTDGHKTPVLAMLLSDSDQAVYVGTDIGVYRVPFEHCQDFATREECLAIEDPYCSWNGTACVNSDQGEQDLETGSNTTVAPSITIYREPDNHMRYLNIEDQPINLYVFAEAPSGNNLRVVNDEIQCSLCTSLQYTEYRAYRDGVELLGLLVNGSSATMNCSCTIVLQIDGGGQRSVDLTLTVDNSNAVSATDDQVRELENFDNDIRRYKTLLQGWQEHVGTSCGITNVQLCEVQ